MQRKLRFKLPFRQNYVKICSLITKYGVTLSNHLIYSRYSRYVAYLQKATEKMPLTPIIYLYLQLQSIHLRQIDWWQYTEGIRRQLMMTSEIQWLSFCTSQYKYQTETKIIMFLSNYRYINYRPKSNVYLVALLHHPRHCSWILSTDHKIQWWKLPFSPCKS